jgi:Ig domain of plant-specific actin-binding protein
MRASGSRAFVAAKAMQVVAGSELTENVSGLDPEPVERTTGRGLHSAQRAQTKENKDVQVRKTPRRLRASAIAIVIATAAAASAPSASAGTIEVGACETASSVTAPADVWSGRVPSYYATLMEYDVPSSCEEASDGMQLQVTGAGSVPWDGATRISTTSPFAGATLSAVDGAWRTNPALQDGWMIKAQTTTDLAVQGLVASCTTQVACRTWSTTGTRLVLPAGTRTLDWYAHCMGAPCLAPARDWLWRATRMTLTVTDPRAPVVVDGSATGAALTAPASWLRGSQSISIRSEDVGGLGVESTRVLVDNIEIPSTNDVWCGYQWAAGSWCAERVVTSATINTASLSDGEHDLTVEAIDASGNSTERRSTFRSDNHGDTPTSARLSPAGWTTTNAFDLAWENPAGRGSPIVAAHITRCDQDGGACETTRVPGANVEQLIGNAVPAAGEWAYSIAIEDQAGNVGPAVPAGHASLAAAPIATVAPSLSGSARESDELTIDVGSWTGVPTPVLDQAQWLICDGSGNDCHPLAAAGGTRLQLRPEHVGATFRVEATARNAGGARTERSAPSAVVQARPPVLTAPPRASTPAGRTVPAPAGAAVREAIEVGGTLDVSGDAWDGTDNLVVAVQWQQCSDAGVACAAIAGATGRAYTPSPDDVGHAVRAEIVASNMAGTATAVTDPVLVLAVAAPNGTPTEGGAENPPPSAGGAHDDGGQAPGSVSVASLLSSTAPRARCVRELRVHLPAQGRLRVEGGLPGRARVVAGDRVVLHLATAGGDVTVRDGRGQLLGTARGNAAVRWIRQSPTRVTARAADGSALVVLGIDHQRGRAIVKGRTCTYAAPRSARVVARADRAARWSAWLIDEHGSPVTDAEIVVSDGARAHRARTDRAGRARLKLSTDRGSRVVTVSFAGDAQHAPAAQPVRLMIQSVAAAQGHRRGTIVELHGTVRGAAREVRVEYRDQLQRWQPLGRASVATNGRWTLRTKTPRQHAGGPQLVVRTVVGAAGTFAGRAGGEIRIDLREAVSR